MAIKLIKRIFSYILVLFGLSVLIFVIVRVMPGDTARMALGARAPESAVAAFEPGDAPGPAHRRTVWLLAKGYGKWRFW